MVLLNGTPGRQFYCKCGLRQGDPLSPLILVLAADLLQAAINDAFARNLIHLPFPSQHQNDYPIIQYADDTILVMPACTQQATTIKDILNDYATSIGLKITFHKSTLITMNCDLAKTQEIGKLPFTYLGLPLGTTRPTIVELMPLVCSMERRLTATLNMISYGGKLSLLNSVITSLIIFALCTLRLPTKNIELLDKIRRNCLWTKKLNKVINATPLPPGTWFADPRNAVA